MNVSYEKLNHAKADDLTLDEINPMTRLSGDREHACRSELIDILLHCFNYDKEEFGKARQLLDDALRHAKNYGHARGIIVGKLGLYTQYHAKYTAEELEDV